MKRLRWDDLQLLIAVRTAGTLRGAAELCHVSSPTLSRRLDDLEAALGEKLLERMATGCFLTAAGERVSAYADQMAEIAAQVERDPNEHDLEGVVRINTEEWISFLLSCRAQRLRDRFPGIELEVLTSQSPFNLSRREADISLRPNPPEGGDLITRRVGGLSFGLYCSTDFAKANELALQKRDWKAVPFVGFDDDRRQLPNEAFLRGLPNAPKPWLRCSYALGIYDGVLGSAGVGVLADFIARGNENLVAVDASLPELEQEVWMTFHRALRNSPRIRAVAEWLAEQFA